MPSRSRFRLTSLCAAFSRGGSGSGSGSGIKTSVVAVGAECRLVIPGYECNLCEGLADMPRHALSPLFGELLGSQTYVSYGTRCSLLGQPFCPVSRCMHDSACGGVPGMWFRIFDFFFLSFVFSRNKVYPEQWVRARGSDRARDEMATRPRAESSDGCFGLVAFTMDGSRCTFGGSGLLVSPPL
jgi:hypothetical protein